MEIVKNYSKLIKILFKIKIVKNCYFFPLIINKWNILTKNEVTIKGQTTTTTIVVIANLLFIKIFHIIYNL